MKLFLGCQRLAITLLGATIYCAGAFAADPLAVRYYEDAVSRFNANDAKGAMIQLKNALQRDPAQLSAKILLGRVYLALEEPRIAEEQLLQAQQLGADPLLIALDLAKARNELGKFDENIQDIVPIRFPPTRQPDLWVELGIARLGKDDTDGAQIAFEEALKIQPGHPGGEIGMARIPLKQKNFSEAEKLIGQVLKLVPDNAKAWFIKGSSAHAQGKFDEAVSAYGRAYELDPRHLQAALGEATAMLESGKPARASALLQPLRAKYPAIATIPYLQSEAYKAMGRTADAEAAQSAAAGIISSYAAADIAHKPQDLLLFGTIAFENGQLETAYKFLAPYVDTNGADIQGRKMLGKTLLGLGKPGEAQRVLVRISASDRADAESLALLGDAHIQLGDYPAADRYYRDALQNHSGGAAIVRRLGMTQFHAGQRDRALGTLQALVDQTQGPANADSALLLGMLYYSENRLNEAGGIADRLVKEDPANLTARNLQAAIAIGRGDTKKGRASLDAIIAEDANFRPARYNLIKLDILEGRTAEADAALRQMLTKDPNDVRALLESARFALRQGDQRVAIQHLEKIRGLEPKNILANIELVNTYLATGQAPQALARAAALDRLVPNEFLVKESVARAQIATGDRQDAAVTLEEVARLAGDDPVRLIHTAKLQQHVGAVDNATWSLSKALAIQPDNISARIELAMALFRARKFEQAESEVELVFKNDSRNFLGISLLGDIRMAQGRAEDAIALYRRGRSIADTPRLAVSLHRALMTAGKPDQALDLLKESHVAHPGEPIIMRVLADHLQFNGDQTDALQLREQLTELTPEDPFAWNDLAVALSTFDTERSLKAALKAHELAPDSAAVLDTLGWTYVQLGELDRGLAQLREALARNGRSATIRYHLAVALQEYGNTQAARRELEQALRMSDHFPERADASALMEALKLLR